MKKNLQVVACILSSLLPLSAIANIQTYGDKALFLSDTGASSATGALPSFPSNITSLVAGDVTITTPNGSGTLVVGQTSSPSWFWTTLLDGNEITLQGNENLNFDLAAPVYSLGFDFAEPNNGTSGCGAGCVNSTFTVSLLSGGVNVDAFTFNAPDAVASFVGVWSDVAFDRVEIRETVGGADSEFFGEVFTGNLSPVPEPETWAMLLSGLILLGLRHRT